APAIRSVPGRSSSSPSSRVLASAFAELKGALSRTCRLIAQLTAGERQEDAFQARFFDTEFANTSRKARKERFRKRIAARFEDDFGVFAGGKIRIRRQHLGHRRLIGCDNAHELLAMRAL